MKQMSILKVLWTALVIGGLAFFFAGGAEGAVPAQAGPWVTLPGVVNPDVG
jgi:hypothetical protein